MFYLHTNDFHHHCNVKLKQDFKFHFVQLTPNFTSVVSILSITIISVDPSPNTKDLFLQLSKCID